MARLFLPTLLLLSVAAISTQAVELTGFPLASNHLGLTLLNQLSDTNQLRSVPENIFFSPYSLSLALGMLYQGSSGQTAKQLESALGYALAGLPLSDKRLLAEAIGNTDRFLTNTTSKYALRAGNALLTDEKFRILESYRETLKQHFHAELFPIDCNKDPEAVMALINDWSAKHTHGKITNLLTKPPSRDTQLALINAIYFKGAWQQQFDPINTVNGTFYGSRGLNYKNVSFMTLESEFRAARLSELNASMIELPYEGYDTSLYAILPWKRGSNLTELKRSLTPAKLDSLTDQLYRQQVTLEFPKIVFKTSYDLESTLATLGVRDVFDGLKADLSGISEQAVSNRWSVDAVEHLATIEVNENGSEATASTHIQISPESAIIVEEEKLYTFDHPFVFLIRHNHNGQLLFVGEINRF